MRRFASVGVLAFFSGAPIVATIVALRQHSWLTFACGVIWLIAYQFTLYTAGIRLSLLGIERAASALVFLSRGNRLELASLEKYVDPETLASVPSVALITASPLDAETPVLRALKSFPDPGRRSVIILTEPPGSELSAQTFFLYHELGHLSKNALAETFASEWSPLLLAMVYGPCVALTANFWCRLGLVLLYAAELFNTKMRTKAELAADTFAVARCIARFGAERVDALLTAIRKHFARTIRDPRDTAYDTVLEFKVRESILNSLQTLLRKDGSANILQDPTRLYMLAVYQTVIMLFLRLLMVILVNLSRVPVTVSVFMATITAIFAIALVGISIQRKYDAETRRLNELLERIQPKRGTR
jgi:hypothetical protein